MIEVTIPDVAALIRSMTPTQRVELADELSKPPPPCCGTPVLGEGTRGPCIRQENHPLPHIDAAGNECLIGIRCRIGAPERGNVVCAKLEGHTPPCLPLALEPEALPQHFGPRPPRPPKGPRGVCQCEHARPIHNGGNGACGFTGCPCSTYMSAHTHGAKS